MQAVWFKPDPTDALELTRIQRKLLSPATQSVTALALQVLPDFALKIDGVVKGYARINCFNNKVLITPVFMNTVDNPESVMAALVNSSFHQPIRFICFRLLIPAGTQIWKISGTQVTPREEILVKHFAAMQKLPSAELNHNAVKHQTDTVTPMMPSAGRKDNI